MFGISVIRLCCTILSFNGKCAGYHMYGCVVQFIDSRLSVRDIWLTSKYRGEKVQFKHFFISKERNGFDWIRIYLYLGIDIPSKYISFSGRSKFSFSNYLYWQSEHGCCDCQHEPSCKYLDWRTEEQCVLYRVFE